MTENLEEKYGRRELLARGTKAGASIAAAGLFAAWLYKSQPPQPPGQGRELVTLPDFSVPHQTGRTLAIVRNPDRKQSTRKALELLGGIERFVKPGETVAIKPNVAFTTPPMLGATTHPDVIGQVVRLCRQAGAREVIVADNPINDPPSCFRLSGIEKAVAEAGGRIVLPKERFFQHTTLENGELIRNWPLFYEPFANADKLIGLAPVKDHSRAGASMSIKNFYGLLGGQRSIFHQNINTIIAELSMMVEPTLVILDGTQSMISNGPTGGSLSDLRPTNTLIASTDMVAADSYGCTLLNMKATDLPYLAMAEKAGSGTTNYESLKPIKAG
jgi:uncharacterized protein (DUF362 family)